MTNFRAVFYRDADGNEPVATFIDELPVKTRVAVKNQLDRLNLLDDNLPHLPFPHSSQVRGDLREARCHHGKQHYRVLYRRSDRLLILLHAFAKNTARIPEAEIATAERRWGDFRARMDAEPRKAPRAAGHDAP